MRLKLLFAAVLLATTTLAFAADPSDVLKTADAAFAWDTAHHGLEGWLSWFAPDAGIVQADAPVYGKDNLRKFYEGLFAQPKFKLEWTADHAELYPSGKFGYTSGRYTMSAVDNNGHPMTRIGSYLTVWKKQADGAWKVLSDFGAPDEK